VTVPVAVHNETGAKQEVQVGLGAEGVDLSGEDQTLEIQNHGQGVSDRDAAAPRPGRVRFEATAVAGGHGDKTEVLFGTLPRGIKQIEGLTGVVDTTRGAVQEGIFVIPEGAIPEGTKLAVVLYPGIDAAVLDALLSLELFPYGCIEQTVHRFLPAVLARAALTKAGSPAAARLERLGESVARGAMRIRNLQNPDGSFGWFRGGRGDLAMTAYAVLGLTGARQAGVKDLDRAIASGASALVKLLETGDEDTRALAHYALSGAGVMDQTNWATTFRRRNDDLSVPGLSWMAMAARRLGRDYDADELIRLIAARRIDDGETTHWKGRKESCFVGSDREATGLAVTALLEAGQVNLPHAERGIRWLLENRVKGGFGTTKETAAFVAAASAWVSQHGAQGFGGDVQVLLDGKKVRELKIGPDGIEVQDRRFVVDGVQSLTAGRHRLGFALSGQGKLRWAARLETVVASDELPAYEHGMAVGRQYLRPEETPIEGQPAPVKPGYTILRPSARPRVEARMLEAVNAGDRVLVRLELDAPRDLQYVMVEDPLPAGFEVLDETTQGTFDWQERRDDRQVFFCSDVKKGKHVLRYVLQATHWGRFTALGTMASPMYLPQVHGRAQGHVLRVEKLPIGGTDAEHPPTPDEVWARAKKLFWNGGAADAVASFRALRDEQPLRDEVIEEIESYLLRHAINTKDAKEIVRAREALLRRNPGLIPTNWWTQRAIAFAYHEIGEVEGASNLYRDLVARGFGLHKDWAQALTTRQREVEGLDALGLALQGFPISNATADTSLRRALRFRELPRPKGREGKVGEPMDREGLQALWDWTAHFAETRLADVGTYALIGALRGSGDLAGAEKAAEAFLERFPGSVHEDDAWWFLAESRFKAFEKDPTEAQAARVRDAATPLVKRTFPDRRGQKVWSPFQARAYHLLARVHHVLGELDKAVPLYWKARSIEDAREAHAFLTESRLRLPATHTVGLDGGAMLPIAYQNVEELRLKAYPVDLQVLFAVRKNLEGLHDVDLSGIVPKHAWTMTFENSKDRRAHEGEVRLPVEEGKPGAWLVVAKAGTHEAKALVVKTDLKVEVQRIDRKVRIYVTDPVGRPVREAYVVVSDGARIHARGLTDGRGLFEAPGVGPKAAVVVSKDDRYASAR
jgi:tetratricopeptide (TPR) repeat protein